MEPRKLWAKSEVLNITTTEITSQKRVRLWRSAGFILILLRVQAFDLRYRGSTANNRALSWRSFPGDEQRHRRCDVVSLGKVTLVQGQAEAAAGVNEDQRFANRNIAEGSD